MQEFTNTSPDTTLSQVVITGAQSCQDSTRCNLEAAFTNTNYPENIIFDQHYIWMAVRDWSVSAGIRNTLDCLGISLAIGDIYRSFPGAYEKQSDFPILVLGAGSNHLVYELIEQGFTSSVGYGDKLYGDTVLLIQRGLATLTPHLQYESPYVFSYITNAFFDYIRNCVQSARQQHIGNAYGANPDIFGDFILTHEIYRDFFCCIGEMLSQGKVIPMHGEFDGETDDEIIHKARDFYLSNKVTLDTLFQSQVVSQRIGFFAGELGETQIDFSSQEVKKQASNPSNMVVGDFSELSIKLEQNHIKKSTLGLILDKRSLSHVGDDAYYRIVTDAISMLKPGGAFISDGFFESYSGVFRDPIRLKEYFADIHKYYDIHVVMVADTHTNTDGDTILISRPGSLVITRKGESTNIVDKLRTSGHILHEINDDTSPHWYIGQNESQYQKLWAFTNSMRKLLRDIYGTENISRKNVEQIRRYLEGITFSSNLIGEFGRSQELRIPDLDTKIIDDIYESLPRNSTKEEKIKFACDKIRLVSGKNSSIAHFFGRTVFILSTYTLEDAA